MSVTAGLTSPMVASVNAKAGRFGVYGGRYVPETLMAALEELEQAVNGAADERTASEGSERAGQVGRARRGAGGHVVVTRVDREVWWCLHDSIAPPRAGRPAGLSDGSWPYERPYLPRRHATFVWSRWPLRRGGRSAARRWLCQPENPILAPPVPGIVP